MDKYEERLRTQALEQRQFSDDYGCVHDAAPSQSQFDLRALLADLDRLRADLEAAREALEFYADPDTYLMCVGESVVAYDHGTRARSALARLGGRDEC